MNNNNSSNNKKVSLALEFSAHCMLRSQGMQWEFNIHLLNDVSALSEIHPWSLLDQSGGKRWSQGWLSSFLPPSRILVA